MECHVCLDAFDAAERRPKSLPCGHTFCLQCLQGLPARECPLDKELFQSSPKELRDNFMVLQFCSRPAEPAAAVLWCRPCNKVASKRCVKEHELCSLEKARAEQAAPLLETLKRGEAGLKSLGEALAAAARDLDVQEYRAQLQQETAGLAAARGRLQEAAGADAAAWEQAKEAAGQGVVSRLAAQLAADLADPSATCSVTVRRGAAGDVAWRGEVRPAEDAAARLLLCGLACRGDLQPEQLEGEQRPADLPPDQHQGEQRTDDHHWQDRPNEVDGELSPEETEARMVLGCRVERGRDWVEAWTEDGDPPGPGTVVDIDEGVQVKWDRTGTCADDKWYSYDPLEKQHVRLAAPAPLKPYMASLGATSLDVGPIVTAADWDEMSTLVADANGRLPKVLFLVGLHCGPCPAWSLKILQRVAPHLKGLQIVAPQQRHLDEVLKMRKLVALSLTDVTREQLQQVIKKAKHYLDHLEVHCTLDAPLGELNRFGLFGVRRLRCGVYPLAAGLALIRACRDVEELQLVAASEQPYGCPDLAAELQSCGLKWLRRMVLVRQTAYGTFCRHDAVSCKKQKAELWAMFLECSCIQTILCSVCNGCAFNQLTNSDAF